MVLRTHTYNYNLWPAEDKAIYEQFCAWAIRQKGRKQSHDKRLIKFRANISSIFMITKIPIHKIIKTEKGVDDAIVQIQNAKRYSPLSLRDYIKFLARLYWFKKTGDGSIRFAPRAVKELCDYAPPENERRAVRDVITREEIREAIKSGNTLDRALLFSLFETGCRISEFQGMKKEDVKEIAEGFEILVKGKTGERFVYIVEGARYFGNWLDGHPSKDSNGPIWISEHTHNVLTDNGIKKRFKNVFESMNTARLKAGTPTFKKKYNHHNFRHSRLTEWASQPGMSPPVLMKLAGHNNIQTSMQYFHPSKEQIKRGLMLGYGKAKQEEVKITEKICPRCKASNPVSKEYCGDCGGTLNALSIVSNMAVLQERITKLESLMLRSRAKGKLNKGV